MEKWEYSRYRDWLIWDVEAKAREAFTKKGKHGLEIEDSVWTKDKELFYFPEMFWGNVKTIHCTNAHQYGYFTSWRALNHLVKIASEMHPDFKNLWKWIFKTYHWNIRQTVVLPDEEPPSSDFSPKNLYNFLCLELYNLLFLLKYEQTDELEKWKNCLKTGGCYMFPINTRPAWYTKDKKTSA
jgi:hypothetical protein